VETADCETANFEFLSFCHMPQKALCAIQQGAHMLAAIMLFLCNLFC